MMDNKGGKATLPYGHIAYGLETNCCRKVTVLPKRLEEPLRHFRFIISNNISIKEAKTSKGLKVILPGCARRAQINLRSSLDRSQMISLSLRIISVFKGTK